MNFVRGRKCSIIDQRVRPAVSILVREGTFEADWDTLHVINKSPLGTQRSWGSLVRNVLLAARDNCG